MSERTVKVTLRAQVAEYQKGMLDAARATRDVGSEAEKLAQKREAFETLGRGIAVGGAAIVGTVALVARSAAQWESAWAGVTKTVDGTPEQLARVEQGLRGLAKELPSSHDEIAAVAEAAGQLGIETENVVAFTRTMIDLGQTTNLSANDAATALARFTNIMGTSQAEVTNLGSALVGLGNNYATTEAEILAMSMRLAGAGKQIGMTEGDVLGLATALSSVGIEAEAGGSAMSKVMIDIAASVDGGGARLEKFAQVAGMSAKEFSTQWRTDPANALAAFVQGLAAAESQGSSTLGVLAEMGITEIRMRDALLRSASAADMFSGAMAMGNEEFKANNALAAEAAKRYETVESKIAMAGNTINDAAISFGQVLLPAIATGAEAIAGFAGFLADLPKPLQGTLTIATGVVGVIALIGGTAMLAVPKIATFKASMESMNWSMKGVSTVAGVAGGALTALVVIIGAVSAAHQKSKQAVEDYASAIGQGESAVRELVAQNLLAKESFLWLEQDSLADKAAKLGVELSVVADYVAGVDGAYEALARQLEANSDGTDDYARRTAELVGGLEEEAKKIEQGSALLGKKTELLGDTADATDALGDAASVAAGDLAGMDQATSDSAGAVAALGDEAVLTEEHIDALADAIRGFGGYALNTRDAARKFEAALWDLQDSIESNGTEIGKYSREAQANEASVDSLVRATLEYSAATWEQSNSQEQASAIIAEGRQRLIEMLEQFGITGQAAQDYADELGLIPEDIESWVKLWTEDASAAADNFIRTYDGRVLKMTIQGDYIVSGSGGYGRQVSGSHRGNLFDHGEPQQFYRGGFPSGIYRGVQGGIHKFAESEMGVPWETYISGRAADRDRNVGIWMETGKRLGVGAGGSSGAGMGDIAELLDMLARQPEAIAAAIGPAIRSQVRALVEDAAWRRGKGL